MLHPHTFCITPHRKACTDNQILIFRQHVISVGMRREPPKLCLQGGVKDVDPDQDSPDQDAQGGAPHAQGGGQSREHELFMSMAAREDAFVHAFVDVRDDEDDASAWERILDGLRDQIPPTVASKYKQKLADKNVRPHALVRMLQEQKLEEVCDIISAALSSGETFRKEGHVVAISMALAKRI